MHKALGSTRNTKEIKKQKAIQVRLGQKLPAATTSWLLLLSLHAVTWMTQIPLRARDHTQLHSSTHLEHCILKHIGQGSYGGRTVGLGRDSVTLQGTKAVIPTGQDR